MGISPIPHRIQVLQSHVAERGGARGGFYLKQNKLATASLSAYDGR